MFTFQYSNAVPHLKLSVELNNIQEKVWLRLGYSALQINDWKLAATAYRRYCAFEPYVCINIVTHTYYVVIRVRYRIKKYIIFMVLKS